jgi:MazG family protein
MKSQVPYDWKRLRQLCRTLRAPGGCNWDRGQTIETLTPYLLEEVYEIIEACAEGDPAKLAEEIGDLLYLLVFAITIAEEESRFTFEDVVTTISRKLIRRHPHVFGEASEDLDFAEVREQWETIKKEEKRKRGESAETLAPGAKSLPALLLAYRIQEKAASFGFDWPDANAVLQKLDEERQELDAALAQEDPDQRRSNSEEETGDLLFTLVNLARHLGTDPEQLLRRTVTKFQKRFARMESLLHREGLGLAEADLDTMERGWQRAKSEEH